MRTFLARCLCGLTLALAAAGCSPSGPGAPRAAKNLLFVLSDQHNARLLGCYGSGYARTPALDRLAAEGVRFTGAFCSTPQCAPSRYTIWTGRYAKSHGLRANRVPERLEEVTLAELLQEAGWRTATIGKHHMMRSPHEHGFDVVIDLDDYEEWRAERGLATWEAAGEWLDFAAGIVPNPVGTSRLEPEELRDGWFASRAIDFLRERSERPFFLLLSFFGPHTPIMPSRELAELVRPEDVELPPTAGAAEPSGHELLDRFRAAYSAFGPEEQRRVLALYAAFVAQMDRDVGRVLDELDALGLRDETVVVYSSDHGDMAGAQGVFGKHYFLYDEVLRVPLIVRVPGGPAGVATDDLVSSVDLAPTLLELLGLRAPDAMQGRSFGASLGRGGGPARAFVFSEVGLADLEWGRSTSVRSATHKLVAIDEDDARREQLFDVEHDPWETRDLAGDPTAASVLAELRAELAAWEARTEDAPPVDQSSKRAFRRQRRRNR